MRILIDLTSLADNFSGIERYASCLAKEMISDETSEFILLFKNEIHNSFTDIENRENINCVVIKGCNKLRFNQLRLPYEIYKHKADCYLFMAFPVPILLFRKNMFSTIHDICCWDCPETMNGLSKWYFRISHRIALKKCRRIITISEFSKKRIIQRLNYPEAKLLKIYCGVDRNFLDFSIDHGFNENHIYRKYNLPEKYILSLSTLEPRKNLRLLVEAYSDLVLNYDFKTSLVLAGRKGWKIDQLLCGIDERVCEQIIFTGFVEENDLPIIYKNSEVFVFASQYEGFGMPPLEAIASGAIVLSSDASSLPEVLGNAACYFKNNDRDELAKSILSLVNMSHCEKTRLIELGKRQVERFAWDIEAAKLLEYIKML